MLFFTIKHCQTFTLTKDHSAGVTLENVCVWRCFFFLFDLIPHFSSFLSSFPFLFFRPFLRISYAGPFEPRLIGVDGAALRRYNGKPNIFGPKI